jgi:ribosome-associated toxin RatA of RatAB toxin-antitoxin module
VRTIDRVIVEAPIERVFAAASEVERWPEFLPHYRWVRVLARRAGGGTVEMSAWRDFGPLRYPTWWVSEMDVLPAEMAVRYRHVRGITSRMDVEWRLMPVAAEDPPESAAAGPGGRAGELKPRVVQRPEGPPARRGGRRSDGAAVEVRIVHQWDGPRWPLIGPWAARAVIGPVFIHHIASRTLAGIKRRAEAPGAAWEIKRQTEAS